MKIRSLNTVILSCLLGAGAASNSCAAESINRSPGTKIKDSSRTPSKLQQIDTLIRKTRVDPEFMFFVVCLPDDKVQAITIHRMWSRHASVLTKQGAPAIFVQGREAALIMQQNNVQTRPAVFSFRNGFPRHTRSGLFEPEKLAVFINYALNRDSDPTPSPEQIETVFDSIGPLRQEGRLHEATKSACDYLYYLSIFNQPYYTRTYTPTDIIKFSSAESQLELLLAEMVHQDQSVTQVINKSRNEAFEQWEADGKQFDASIQFWVDMAWLSNTEDEVVDWIDQHTKSSVVAQILSKLPMGIIQKLFERELHDAVVMSYSYERLERNLSFNKQFMMPSDDPELQEAAEKVFKEASSSLVNDVIMYHTSLLITGQTHEAWRLISLIADEYDPKVIGHRVCQVARQTGIVTPKHIEIAKQLDPQAESGLVNSLQAVHASGPAFD